MIKLLIFITFFSALTQVEVTALSDERFLEQPLDHFEPTESRDMDGGGWQLTINRLRVEFTNHSVLAALRELSLTSSRRTDIRLRRWWLQHWDLLPWAWPHARHCWRPHFCLRDKSFRAESSEKQHLHSQLGISVIWTSSRWHGAFDWLHQEARLVDARLFGWFKSDFRWEGRMCGGKLASWFRVKYVHHVDGVWSSSSFVEIYFIYHIIRSHWSKWRKLRRNLRCTVE